ncbi:MAG: TSUP family transporter [Gammaproteobacteria bacterium]|nr:TSUP family transporter [Gammaproteobacteria bacterium]MBU1556074.1 TSUP family transporter [Gammaproteobacteria bacterium]MBU2070010.1 TSUP family transporter [Gammaproteobacteria bacterium]MBU2182595.1 TSUP family transporter [Gammaproteobacteria bacterium]MBU2204997.1 TSUP family transporter [Gammaproteobacteria bacterium]
MFDVLAADPNLLAILCAVAFTAGFIDAIAGGGGLLTVPALLTAGLPPHVALGTNKLASTFGSFTASLAYYRKKLFNPVFWRRSLLYTAIGAILGTIAVDLLSKEALEKILPVVILLAAVYSLFSRMQPDDKLDLPLPDKKLFWQQRVQGLTLGFYDGIAGPGAGAFWMVSTMALYRINLLLTCGVARSMNFISNGFSLVAFIMLGHVNFGLGIAMGLCLMLGAWIGAHSAIKFGGRFIRPVFICVVIAIAVRLAWQAWSN